MRLADRLRCDGRGPERPLPGGPAERTPPGVTTAGDSRDSILSTRATANEGIDFAFIHHDSGQCEE